jgi:AraC-like DNA-binding protein
MLQPSNINCAWVGGINLDATSPAVRKSAHRLATDDGLGPTLARVVGRLGEPLTVRQLAEHAKVGERTFNRPFAAQLGTAPKRWLLHNASDSPASFSSALTSLRDQIAREAGFASTPALRSNLRRQALTTPDCLPSQLHYGRFRRLHPQSHPAGTRINVREPPVDDGTVRACFLGWTSRLSVPSEF